MIIVSTWESQDNEFDKIDLVKKGNVDILINENNADKTTMRMLY